MLKFQLISFTGTFNNSYLTLYTRNTKKMLKNTVFWNNSLLTESNIFDISIEILRIFFYVFWHLKTFDYITGKKVGLF